jgi:hypothetical protein
VIVTAGKPNINPWLTSGIINSCKQKNKLYKLVCQNKYPKDLYVTYRNKLTTVIRNSKLNYYSSAFDKNIKNPKMAWKVINEMRCNQTNTTAFPKNLDVNDINKFFIDLGKNAISDLPPANNYEIRFPTNKNTFIFDPITPRELEQTTHSLRLTNSCGQDGLSNKLTSLIIDCISLPLSIIFNKSVDLVTVPQNMKIAKVIPIFKSGDNTKLINYRPISILPVLSKILERLIYNRMIKFIDKYSILTTSQYGFRSGHSTNSAIIDLINTVTKHMDSGDKVAGLFIDISKAFNSLDRKILLKKIYAYGFRGVIYNWFSSYLDNRFQFVEINGVKSFLALDYLGVPQGSVMGPLLFLLYINDLPLLSNLCKFILFADDTTVLFHEKSLPRLSVTINSILPLLHSWFTTNRLSLNLIKTCILPFALKNFTELDNISINNVPIACVQSTKFLGVYIDSNLSWTTHTNYVCNKLSHCAAMLRACCHLLPLNIRIQIYFAFGYPYLTYGIECWGTACKNRINPVIVKQKLIIRCIFGLSIHSHCAPYAAFAGILYVPDVTNLILLKLAHKAYHGFSVPSNILKLFKRSEHVHNTRCKLYNFFELQSRLKIYHDSPILHCIRLWNNLPVHLKMIFSVATFKHLVTCNVLSMYV